MREGLTPLKPKKDSAAETALTLPVEGQERGLSRSRGQPVDGITLPQL